MEKKQFSAAWCFPTYIIIYPGIGEFINRLANVNWEHWKVHAAVEGCTAPAVSAREQISEV